MKEIVKKSVGISPFNCIAMKDIKDKDTGKAGFRQLSDCVSSLSEGVTKLKDFMENSPDSSESSEVDSHIKSIIAIQKSLLKMCDREIDRQGSVYNSGDKGEIESNIIGVNSDQQLAANKVPEVKTKIKA